MENHVTAYPLAWPDGRVRVRSPKSAPFKMTMARARDHLIGEIRMLGGRQTVLSSNAELRIDGLPYSNRRIPDDPAVAVYFTYKKKQHCFACDDWDTVTDNVRAVGKTIEALRGIARWGTGDMMERAFQGFVALPSPETEPWWSVLGFYDEGSALIQGDFEMKSKKLMQKYHPDNQDTGDEWKFKQVSKARERGREVRSEP